jgi:hypothetical protein
MGPENFTSDQGSNLDYPTCSKLIYQLHYVALCFMLILQWLVYQAPDFIVSVQCVIQGRDSRVYADAEETAALFFRNKSAVFDFRRDLIASN